MKYSKCTMQDLEAALAKVNKAYDNNIIFNRLDNKCFTLKVKDCKRPGHRLGFPHPTWTNRNDSSYKQKRLSSACWHVHGSFFDALFFINPNAVIYSRDNKITVEEGNWIDIDVGSIMEPCCFSDLCECNLAPQVKTVKQSQMTGECWNIQIWGKDHCQVCEFKDTPDCGGQNILATGKNESGHTVPLS